MKTKFYLNLKSWLLMMLMLIGAGGNLWADEVSVTTFTSISGNLGDYISYEAAKGTAATAPAVNSGEIRVYQNGGTFKVSAKNGAKINSIVLGSSMATKVTYAVDNGDASSEKNISANGTCEVKDLNCTSVLFTCKGTNKNSRLYVNKLTVTYTKTSSGPVYPDVSFASNSLSLEAGETKTNAINKPNDLTVTYSSDDASVATVNQATGEVTGIKRGSTTIKASWNQVGDTYAAGYKEFTVNVSGPLVTVDNEGNVIFDLTENDWGFPEGNDNAATAEASFTNNNYTIKVSAKDAYYYYPNYNSLLIGKSGSKLTLPAFDFAVEKIEIVGRTNASTKVTQNIYVGEKAVSTETTGATGTYTYYIDVAYQGAGNVYTLKVTNANNTQITGIKVYKKVAAAVETPVISLASGNYLSAQTVTLSCETEGAVIYYTTDGTEPTSASTQYNGAITISETTTLKAIAYVGEDASAVASATYTFPTILSLADLNEKEKATYYARFNNAVVTYVSGKYAFIEEEGGAIMFYNNNIPYAVGQVLNGVAEVTWSPYSGQPEATSIVGIEGLFTDNTTTEAKSPAVVTLAQLSGENKDAYISRYVKVEKVAASDVSLNRENYSATLTQGEATLAYYGRGAEVKDGYYYNITGFLGINNGNYQLVAYSADDVEEIPMVAQFNGQKYESLQAALDAAEAAEPAVKDIVIDLLDDAELTIAPRSDRLAIGTATTKSITINGNDHKLTFMTTDTDWNDVSTRNDDQTKLVLNDMTIDQGGVNTQKTWNSYDINFNCAVELNNVTSNRPIAFKNNATLKDVTISDTSGDYYGIWISPRVEGQNISIDGLTLTAGRGIKVDDEYIDNPEKVTLDIANATFNTTKKAAILVKSKADTDITVGENVNIENVAADKTNAVWVDEDNANLYGLVSVAGATMAPESSEADYAAKIVSGDKPMGYYKTFAAAVEAAETDQVVALLKDVTYELADGQTLKVDKNGHDIAVTVPEGCVLDQSVNENVTTYSSFAGIVINNVEELKAFRDAVNNGTSFAGKTVKLAADLDLSGEENWTPIGNLVAYPGQSFNGVFDGDGHKISNVTVVDQTTPEHAVAGLFGSVVNGTIKNLTVENVNLTSSHYAGGIVAYTSNKPTIENCHVIGGTITSVPELLNGSYDDGDKVGGIMGYATAGSTINNCTVDGLTIKAHRDLGGIVGFSAGIVTNNTVMNTTIIQSYENNGYKDAVDTYDYIVGRNGGATLENNVYEGQNNVLTVEGAVAKIGEKYYGKLQAAFKAAKADETVTLLKDYDAKNEAMAGGTRQFVINKSITFDGGGFTLTTKQRGIGIGNVNGDVTENIDVTIKNVTVLNTASGARCIDTRGKIGSLTLEGVTLNTQGAPSGYTQPLTIGGNQSDVANVTITNSTIQTNDNATAYYAIITFNPVNMTISNSTIKGWANVYAKGQDGSAGSAGSVFNFDKCTLKSSNAYSNTSNAFSAFTIEDNNVTINVTNSDIVITNTGDQLQSIAGYPKDNTLSGNKVTLGEGNKVKFVDNESCDFVINQSEGSEFTVTGGLFSTVVPDEFCAEGLTTVANTDEATKDEYPYAVGVKVELAQPIIFHDGGEYEGKLTVAIAGEGVKYTLNGGAEQTYSAPFTISETTTVKAWAEKDGVKSDEVEKTFTIVAKQAGAEVADGYYNIKTNDGKFVNVAGRKTVTLVSGTEGKAGTVIRVNADAEGVKVLRSQGVDLPGYAKKAMNYVPEIVQLAVDKLHAEGAGELLGETGLEKIMDKFNESFDYNLYLKKDGEAYRIYGRTPSMKPVVDFYAENKANVDAKLPELEEFINKAIQKVLQKTNGSGASVLVPFSLQTIWERMGSTLTNPADDEAKFYEEVLSSEANVWNFAYQTAMLYWGNLKNHPRFAEIQNKLGDYSKYIDKVENIRPNFKYYIVPSASGVDFISQGNSKITDASTAWTMESVREFKVNFETEQAFNIYPTTSGGKTIEAKEYYTTLYTDFAYTLPEGVKAYKVTEITEKYGVAKREEITGVIPAQTPVLLVSNEGAQTTLTLTTEAGSAVTGNLLVGADALINEYQIKTPQVVSLFDMAKSILGESAYKTYLEKYEHLMLKNAGTVGNKYFFGLTADDLKGVTNLRVLTLDNAGMNPGFHDIWEKVDANKAVILTNDYNPVKLFLVGDVNRDGNISIADVTALVNIILGKATYPKDNDKYDFAAANVNNDKAITISDVTALVNIILGK